MMTLDSIRRAEKELTCRFQGKLVVNHDLNRTLVSFQANKRRNHYRWFKYKEGFSASLVRYVLDKLHLDCGRLLDPFAGSGATLFGAAERGLDALGIELLPVGCQIIEARQRAASTDAPVIAAALDRWLKDKPWQKEKKPLPFRHLRITRGGFPPANETSLGCYLAAADHEAGPARMMLRFAAFCILEEISYTRKDGQYLRWDYRSDRKQGVKPFDKGVIVSFEQAIEAKLAQISDDLRGEPLDLFAEPMAGKIDVLQGSCLDHFAKAPVSILRWTHHLAALLQSLRLHANLCLGVGAPWDNRRADQEVATEDGFLYRRESRKTGVAGQL